MTDEANVMTKKFCYLSNYQTKKKYLRDKTGERRFNPILVNPELQRKHPMEMTEKQVDQIWGGSSGIIQTRL